VEAQVDKVLALLLQIGHLRGPMLLFLNVSAGKIVCAGKYIIFSVIVFKNIAYLFL
jgi:hypothetical protein